MDERRAFPFDTEPRGEIYRTLLQFCVERSSELLLVVRDPERDSGPAITARLEKLGSMLRSRELVSEWPGTILYGHTAAVYRYEISAGLADTLADLAAGLFDWLHPYAPEDPCFLRESDAPLLVTISHEREAYFLLNDAELASLQSLYPMLAAAIHPE